MSAQTDVEQVGPARDERDHAIAAVAHDLQNPLAAIILNADLLQAGGGGGQHHVSAISRNALRMQAMIQDLVDLGRSDSHGSSTTSHPVDLARLARDVVRHERPTARSAGVTLVASVGRHPLQVTGHHDDLVRAVVNLVGNAVKYSDPGTTVRLAVRPAADQVVLTCADEGLGISQEDQEHVFTPYFRSGDPAVRSRPGTGLGLCIVGQVVERHRGRISVTSELGRGSTFEIALPLWGTSVP